METGRLRTVGTGMLLAAAVVAAYWPALHAGFVWDDDNMLTANGLIRAADGLRRFWLSTEASDYWPVTSTSLWLEWRLWGMHAWGYHATNVALHLADCWLLWAVLRRLRVPGAGLAAFLFALHPVNVESVAWIAERKNLLAMLFSLLAVLGYLAGEESRQGNTGVPPEPDPPHGRDDRVPLGWSAANARYWLSLFAFALAMLSKGSVAVVPLVLTGIVAWRRRPSRADLCRLAPFFLVSAALVLVDVWFQKHGTGVVIRQATPLERVLGAGAIVWFYLLKALWPANLIFVYPQWTIVASDWRWWVPAAAAAAVTAILGWLALRRPWAACLRPRPAGLALGGIRFNQKAARYCFAAWLYFLAALLPVMGFTDVYFMRFSLVADHYEHLAIVGVLALAGAGWARWAARSRAAYAAAAAVLAVLGALTWRQCLMYRDAETLYRSTLDRNPSSWMVENNLADLLARDPKRIPEAIPHFLAAIRLNPRVSNPHNGLGDALVRAGRVAEGTVELERAVRLDPRDPAARNNLGEAYAAANRYPEAVREFEAALTLEPRLGQPRHNLGLVHFWIATEDIREGALALAAEELRAAIRYDDGLPEAHYDLGVILLRSGRAPEAAEEFRAALRIRPDLAAAKAFLDQLSARSTGVPAVHDGGTGGTPALP